MITNPKTFIVKILGVTPEEIGILHKNLEPKPGITTSNKHVMSEPDLAEEAQGFPPRRFVNILTSKLDTETELYTVEIRVNAVAECYLPLGDSCFLLAPRAALDQIVASFAGLFPEEETLQRVPADNA